jgi:mono/diheme cytochrome c family protein
MWILVAVCGFLVTNSLCAEYGHTGFGDFGGGRASSESGYGSPNSNCQPVRPGGGGGYGGGNPNGYAAAAPIVPMPIGPTQVTPPQPVQPVQPSATGTPAPGATATGQTSTDGKEAKPAAPATTAEAKVDPELFKTKCLSCHANGKGPNLKNKTAAEMIASIEAGRMPQASTPPKPGDGLNPEEKASLIAYLKTNPAL